MLRHFLSAEVRKAEEAIQEETTEQDFLRPHSPIHPHITSQFTVFTQKTVQKSQTVQLRGRSRGRGEADTSQLREGERRRWATDRHSAAVANDAASHILISLILSHIVFSTEETETED